MNSDAEQSSIKIGDPVFSSDLAILVRDDAKVPSRAQRGSQGFRSQELPNSNRFELDDSSQKPQAP